MPPAHPPDDQSPDRPDVEMALRDLGPAAERLKRTPDTLARDADAGGADAQADTFAGYDIIRELHRGGQGIVYLAVQRSTHRKVALKVMREGPLASPSSPARFEREIRVLGQLNHPNIVTIHDSGRSGSGSFFVMDYVSGQSLDEWARELKGEPRERFSQVLRLFVKICDAVQAAHRRGVVHRDLKPSNIRVDFDGEPRVLDFGVAKVASEEDSSLMTLTGQFVGSLPWASPEQAEGHPDLIDSRTDVYSLGVILYSLLTGQFPYDVTGTMRDVLDRIAHTPPARPRTIAREIDGEIETILLKALSKDRERRYETAGELGDDVRRYLGGQPIRARRDSLGYLFRTRSRRVMAKHPVSTGIVVVLLAALTAQFPFTWFIFAWTPVNSWFEHALYNNFPLAPNLPLRNVALFEIRDNAGLDVAASHHGIKDVDPQNAPKSVRRLHGRFMQRLAAAKPRAVVWDLHFAKESKFDADFVRGIEALQHADIDVVLGVEAGSRVIDGLPAVVRQFLTAGVKWGYLSARPTEERWVVTLALEREHEPLRPSLAIMALAAARHPGAEITLHTDADPRAVHLLQIVYEEPVPDVRGAKRAVGPMEHVRFTAIRTDPDPSTGGKVRNATLAVHVPADFARRAGSYDYGDALICDQEQLRAWCEGKVVLIGDVRPGIDRFPHPSGGVLPGCYIHAAAIEALLRGTTVKSATLVSYAFNATAAMLGLMTARLWGRRGFRRLGWILVLTSTTIVISVAAFWLFQYLHSPLVPALALILGCELTAWSARMRSSGRETLLEG